MPKGTTSRPMNRAQRIHPAGDSASKYSEKRRKTSAKFQKKDATDLKSAAYRRKLRDAQKKMEKTEDTNKKGRETARKRTFRRIRQLNNDKKK
ncbi:MAG: hypothetical protein V2J10_13290 [Wenzhouxiangella sp.]|jgi:hypothetical protein|nr:hypothetical protein [Wenzhouxiangella sp.]